MLLALVGVGGTVIVVGMFVKLCDSAVSLIVYCQYIRVGGKFRAASVFFSASGCVCCQVWKIWNAVYCNCVLCFYFSRRNTLNSTVRFSKV